jgi:hypothetical protein
MNVKTILREGDLIEDNEGNIIEKQRDWNNGCVIEQWQWYKGKNIAHRQIYKNKYWETQYDKISDRRNFWQSLTVKIEFPEPYNPKK